MKTQKIKLNRIIALMGTLALLTGQALAQDAADKATAPQLSQGVSQILQLEQAKVSDSTVISYIKTTGNSYSLSAEQILYLRQQGISDAVLTAMLTPSTASTPTPTATPLAQAVPAAPAVSTTSTPAVTVQPAVAYVQPVPAPCYYAPYYYPVRRCYLLPRPVVAVGWGRCGGWHVGVAW